jgi:predicted TIM-barrel fold metal-dependent hydrolase
MSDEGQIIDLHAHWLPESTVATLAARRDAPRIVEDAAAPSGYAIETSGTGWAAGRLLASSQWFDIRARLAQLDEAGIGHQLLSWPTTLGIDVALGPEETLPLWSNYNDELGHLVQTHPDRFSGVAVLSTADVDWSVKELRRARTELGLVGAVLPVGSVVSREAADHFAPVFEVAQELGSHIYLHTGHANAAVPGQPAPIEHADLPRIRSTVDTAAHFTQALITLAFSGFLDDYPNVTVQVAMLGGSGLIGVIAEQVALSAERFGPIDVEEAFSRIYLDTGAAGRGSEAIGLATRVFGASQIVFGTDLGPFPDARPVIENVLKAPVTATDRRAIFHENARRLLGRVRD